METSLSYMRETPSQNKILVVARYSIFKIPALGSPGQEDEEFKASLVYRDLTEKQTKQKLSCGCHRQWGPILWSGLTNCLSMHLHFGNIPGSRNCIGLCQLHSVSHNQPQAGVLSLLKRTGFL